MTATLTPAKRNPQTENPHHERRWVILVVLCVAQLMVVLDATIVNIALPSAQRALGFSNDNRQWIITAYALSFGSLLLLGGRVSDLFGRKWTFVGGLLGFAAASAIGGAAPSFGVLVAARAAQGAFGALLAPAALSLLTTTFSDGPERQKAFGAYSAIAGGGSAIGLLLGGVLTEYLTWRWCLYVNLTLAVPAALAGILLLVNQHAAVRNPIDIPGVLTVTAGLFAVVYGVSNAETSSWTDSATVGFIAAGLGLLVGFVLIERRVAHPLLPMRVVLDRDRAAAFVGIGLASMGMFGVFLFLTYYLQQTLGFSPVETGLAFLSMTGGVVLSAIVGGSVLLPRLGRKILVPAGMLLGTVGMVLLTQIDTVSSYATDIAPGLVLVGVGIGMVFAASFSGGTVGIAEQDAGVASATVNTFQQIGGSIGTALLSTVFATAVENGIARSRPDGPRVRLLVVAAIFIAGAVITGLLYRPGVPEVDPQAAPVVGH